MQIISLVIGILSMLGFLVGIIPCLGSLNWLNIPFALVGLIIGIMAMIKAPQGRSAAAIIGVVLCAIAIVIGALRLMVGGGIF